jgi:Parvulin-like peptidyl-prolyl isomerase
MKTHLLTIALFLFPILILAQNNDPIIMTINGKNIKKSEFDSIYNKNNSEDAIEKKSLEEYIDLFKNFKLKVAEAEAQGLDTTALFRSELAEYRSQIAKPYQPVLAADESLVKKEYDRLNEFLEVSHILILFPREAGSNTIIPPMLPADTLETYKKANLVYSRLKKGEDFSKLVLEYTDDAQTKGNAVPGYLGWISGMMLYPVLEDVAFSTEVGKFSEPIRTNYGYHIIKVLNKKPNPGKVRASHILIKFPEKADEAQKKEVQNKIDEIYQKVLAGEDFAELAREYSQDGSASRGGDLDWFESGMMVPEFEAATFALKEINDVSKPFSSPFGYHIVKLTDRKALEPFEEKREEIASKFSNSFFHLIHKRAIEDLKKDEGFTPNDKAYEALRKDALELFPTNDAYLKKYADSNETLFSIGDSHTTIAEFISYLQSNSRSTYYVSIDFLNNKLNLFEYNQLIKFLDKSLEDKHPEFRNLMQEYYDGTLVFEISNKEVWNKASEDTEGLERFFEKNKNNFKWAEPHYKGYVVLVKDTETKKKIQKETSKMQPEAAVNYMLENYKVGTVSYVKVEKGLFKKRDNVFVDEAIFKTGKAEYPENFEDFLLVGKTLKSPESYTDVRGQVITEYQDYLEKDWIKELNEKYPVVLYKDVIFKGK